MTDDTHNTDPSDDARDTLQDDAATRVGERLATRLRTLRIRLGLTQAQMGNYGIGSQDTITRLERGEARSLTYRQIDGIERALYDAAFDWIDLLGAGRSALDRPATDCPPLTSRPPAAPDSPSSVPSVAEDNSPEADEQASADPELLGSWWYNAKTQIIQQIVDINASGLGCEHRLYKVQDDDTLDGYPWTPDRGRCFHSSLRSAIARYERIPDRPEGDGWKWGKPDPWEHEFVSCKGELIQPLNGSASGYASSGRWGGNRWYRELQGTASVPSEPSVADDPSVAKDTDEGDARPLERVDRALETIEIHTTELGAYALDPDTGILLDIAVGEQAPAELISRAIIRQQAGRPSAIAYDGCPGQATKHTEGGE